MLQVTKYEEADNADWPLGGRVMLSNQLFKIVLYKIKPRASFKWCLAQEVSMIVMNGQGFLMTPLHKLNVKTNSSIQIEVNTKCCWQNMTDEEQSLIFLLT